MQCDTPSRQLWRSECAALPTRSSRVSCTRIRGIVVVPCAGARPPADENQYTALRQAAHQRSALRQPATRINTAVIAHVGGVHRAPHPPAPRPFPAPPSPRPSDFRPPTSALKPAVFPPLGPFLTDFPSFPFLISGFVFPGSPRALFSFASFRFQQQFPAVSSPSSNKQPFLRALRVLGGESPLSAAKNAQNRADPAYLHQPARFLPRRPILNLYYLDQTPRILPAPAPPPDDGWLIAQS